LSLLAFLGLGTMAFAQITGVVNDANNFPESDVEVTVKGTNKVAFTDEKGNFNIDAKVGDTLVINGKEFKVTSNNLGALKYNTEETVNLEEALVTVAYGKQRKEAIVGAVAVVDSKVLEKQQATNPLSAIQGSVSGVSIINSGGQPGSSPIIRIRGIGSVNASAEPLIVLDGVPFNGNISMISQDMIESINVLKDAGAAALYGARAANGVILIETKKGRKSSAPRITFTSQFGVADQAVKMHKTVGAEDFMKYTWEAMKNGNAGGAQYATDNLITRLGYNPYGTLSKPIDTNGNLASGANLLWDTNWEDLLINNSAIRQEHSINIDGGNEHTTYNFGASYLNQEGSVVTSKFERTTIKGSMVTKANDWLELGVNTLIGLGYENGPTQSGASFQSPIQWRYSMSNIYPVYKRNGVGGLLFDVSGKPIYDYGQDGDYLVNGTRPLLSNENAVGALYEGYLVKNRRTNINVNGHAKVTFTDYLSFRSQLSYQQYLLDNSQLSSNLIGNAASVNGRIEKNRDTQDTKNFTNSLNFDKKFGNHSFRVDAIMDMYDFTYEMMGAQGTGFLTGIGVLGGTTAPESVSGAVYRERILGYMGRVSYDFAGKYFLEGSYRKEASTRFHSDVRWGDFFSVGGGWIISKENFLKGSDVVSNLKLRASYGEVGNNQTLNSAQDFATYFPYIQSISAGWSQLGQAGVLIGQLPDANLSWEKTASTNVGLDFGFFKNRITGSIDYFNRESVDLIMGGNLPYSGAGQSTILTNIGSVKNYGLEFNLQTVNVRNDNFEWTTNINVGFTRNKILKLNGSDSMIQGTKLWEVGNSVYDWYLWEWAGVDPTDGAGMWYTDDANGNKVTTKNYAQAKRYLQDKSSLPDFEGGFSNYIRYKNFDLNVLFNFSVGSYVYDSSYASLMNTGKTAGYQWSEDIKDRWQNPGDITNTPKLTMANNDYNTTSTRFLFKNDYLRLKALNFGYNFSQKNVEQMGLKGLRIYFQGDNLLTFQSHKGIDPEQNVSGSTNSRSYQQRIYTVGFRVNL